MSKIERHEGGIEQFSRGYERFGFNETPDGSISFAEWCPGALRVSVVGDFSLRLSDYCFVIKCMKMDGIVKHIRASGTRLASGE
jgi:hypothetical protein